MNFFLTSSSLALQEAADEWAGVELYHAEIVKFLSLGVLVALIVTCFAVFGVSSERRRGVWLASQVGAVLVAALALWAGLFMGVHMGYGEWQGSPGHGDKAYADGAQLTGALMFGWMPGGFLASFLWALLTVCKMVFGRKPEPIS